MWKVILVASLMATSAAVAGVAQEYRLNHALSLVARGFMPEYDVEGNFHWQGGTVDAKIARAVQQTAMDEDSASVFDDMARHPPSVASKRKVVAKNR